MFPASVAEVVFTLLAYPKLPCCLQLCKCGTEGSYRWVKGGSGIKGHAVTGHQLSCLTLGKEGRRVYVMSP